MKKILRTVTTLIMILTGSSVFAQYASDAFRYSEINQTGTARFQGVGGNHAALGGDASNISGNPAGLGFYNRSEFSLSPAVSSVNTESSYIDRLTTDSKSNFNMAQASLVLTSQPSFQRKWKRTSFGLSFSRQQSFSNKFSYAGQNQKSAYIDQVVEDANAAGYTEGDLNADFDSGNGAGGLPTAYSLPAAYYQMYMINPNYSQNSNLPTWQALDQQSIVDQVGSFDSKGANTQFTLAYGGNYDDKFYMGGALGFDRIKYSYSLYHDDLFQNSPEFISISQDESFTVSGNGINLTLGMMYKFTPALQLGGSLTTPTFMAIKETFNQSVSAQFVDNLVSDGDGNLITPPYDRIDMAPNDFVYNVIAPFKGSVGLTYLVNRSGFITGTIEYIGYQGMRVNTNYLNDSGNNNFKNQYKEEISNTYRNTINVRVGGEYRIGLFRARAGIAYIADPYQIRTDGIDRSKIIGSAGIGVRKNKFFADITGAYTAYKSSFTPYVVNNNENYYSASINNKLLNITASVGVFFGN